MITVSIFLYYYRGRPADEVGGREGGGGWRGGAAGGRRVARLAGGRLLGGGHPDRRATVRPGRGGRRPALQGGFPFYDDFIVFAYCETFQMVISERAGDRLAAVGGGGGARRRRGALEAETGGGRGGGGGGDWRDRPRRKLF